MFAIEQVGFANLKDVLNILPPLKPAFSGLRFGINGSFHTANIHWNAKHFCHTIGNKLGLVKATLPKFFRMQGNRNDTIVFTRFGLMNNFGQLTAQFFA